MTEEEFREYYSEEQIRKRKRMQDERREKIKKERIKNGLPPDHYTMNELKGYGMFDDATMKQLIRLAKNPENMIVSGGPGSGTTTLLAAMCDYFPGEIYEASVCGELSRDRVKHIFPDNDYEEGFESFNMVYTIPDEKIDLLVVQHFPVIKSKPGNKLPVIWHEAHPRHNKKEEAQIKEHSNYTIIRMDKFKIVSIGKESI